MKPTVTLLIGCLLVLSFSGCAEKSVFDEPIVNYVKPTMPDIKSASIEQCRYSDILDNSKCVLTNYLEVKKERDMLRASLEKICE